MIRRILFGSETQALVRGGLDAGATRQRVIAENIANVATPGYRAGQVRFEELLQQARGGSLAMARTSSGHLSGESHAGRVPAAERVASEAPAPAGAINNVDVERELVALQKNQIHFQALSQALANQYRLAIMHTLKEGERCVSDLAAELGISVHNVSQHLRILRQRLLVRSRKEGQTVYYSVTNPKFVQACSLIREALIEEYRAAGQSLRAVADLDSQKKPGKESGGSS